MSKLILHEGPSDQLVLDIAPTMATITHGGETYFRMKDVRAYIDDEQVGAYLWNGYGDMLFKRLKEKGKIVCP